MSDQKLRPEQRKVWRRIYLTAFEGGASVDESKQMAEQAVKHWEERGAFEDDPPITSSLAWEIVAPMLKERYPDAFEAVYDAIVAVETTRRAGLNVASPNVGQ